MIETREEFYRKWTECYEACSIEELRIERDRCSRYCMKDLEAIAQRILDRKVAEDCGVGDPIVLPRFPVRGT